MENEGVPAGSAAPESGGDVASVIKEAFSAVNKLLKMAQAAGAEDIVAKAQAAKEAVESIVDGGEEAQGAPATGMAPVEAGAAKVKQVL